MKKLIILILYLIVFKLNAQTSLNNIKERQNVNNLIQVDKDSLIDIIKNLKLQVLILEDMSDYLRIEALKNRELYDKLERDIKKLKKIKK